MAQDYDLRIIISGKAQDAIKALNDVGSNIQSLGTSISTIGKELDRVGKEFDKFGKELTTKVTLPLVALAGLSLKKVFDEAREGLGTSEMNSFAASVQNLKRTFDELLITIGTTLIPTIQPLINIAINLMNYFKSLDKDTKSLAVTIGLIAAAIGPIVLVLGTLISAMGKIMLIMGPIVKLFGTLLKAISPIKLAAAGLVLSLVGIANVFLKLRESGLDFVDSLILAFKLFVTGFANYIVNPLLSGVQSISGAFGTLFGLINEDMAAGFNAINRTVQGWKNTFAGEFRGVKGQVDTQLKGIGSSAASSFTLGFSDSFQEFKNGFSQTFKDLSKPGEGFDLLTKEAEEFAKKSEATAKQIQMNISGGMSNALVEFAEGSKTAEQAFSDFARSTIRQITQMIIQAQIFNSLFGGANNTGGFWGGLGAAATPMATGGYVQGPGTSTSDSILARLSNGEYVTDARTVRHYGVDFFRNLQRMSKFGVPTRSRGVVPGYADGGLVSSSASAGPQVIIENKGTPKEGTSSFDPATAVTTVILEDMQKNGSISKGIQRTFGVKRGGFT